MAEGASITAGKRVLVVNDTQEILELFDDLLGELGIDVVTMSYAPRELERIRDVAPDLIVLDFVFGDKETLGWQLLQKLKMDRSLESVPVVICTAAAKMVEELQGYLTEQGVLVILKPFNVDQLEEAVTAALTAEPTTRDVIRKAGKSKPRTPKRRPPARGKASG
jgi:CheY-like chemotaxis protein